MMDSPQIPDQKMLEAWLKESGISFELCGQCDGLHLSTLRTMEGVIDSRVFLENYGLLLTTELEIRPMAVLPVAADLGQINMDYPTLKVFMDIADEATPQLVVAGVLPSAAGLTRAQVAAFIDLTLEESRQLAAECLKRDYLFAAASGNQPEQGSSRLH